MRSARVPGRRPYLVVSLAGIVAVCVTVTTRAHDAPCSRVRGWIERELERRNDPSLAIAVARDGRILCEAAFGWADRERGVSATPHTRYSVASVSKPITATGLMLLAERGGIDLDAPHQSVPG